jgi:hypothetical protein
MRACARLGLRIIANRPEWLGAETAGMPPKLSALIENANNIRASAA